MVQNILDYLSAASEKYPQKTAVIEEDRSVTYSELARNACSVGSFLLHVGCFRQPVGVYMEKGIPALSAFFGIVTAGGFYCMLSTELPGARLAQIQEVLQAKIILTTEELKEKAAQIFPGCTVCTVEECLQAPAREEELWKIRRQMIDTDPLYVNFTSGSTGVPKGIAVAHRSVVDFIGHFTELFGIGSDDIIANQAPFDFDVSVKDIYSALKTGATLVIVPRKLFSAPSALLDYLCDNRVTTMIWAVSALCLITAFHGLDYRVPETVRKILFSGEVMPYKHLRLWQEHLPDAVFVNLYGPTEITCNCTYHVLDNRRDYSSGIPIGQPFPNEDVFLLDEAFRKISLPGVAGQIAVRGTALALGYYRLEDQNEKSFIRNPLNTSYPERIYLTGDLGQYDDRGDLLFCGRIDHQVKYLGHRIELEEVEKCMSMIDGVERCFCTFENDRLKGYYVGSVDKGTLHSRMKETLPVYMIPGFLRRLESMPMTKNGKIDRKQAVLAAERRTDGGSN